jgi:asparagine synthase (glutamine-hydrolysing)
LTHFFGIFLDRDVPQDRGKEICAKMARAFGPETFASHSVQIVDRLCVGFAVPHCLANRDDKNTLFQRKSDLTLFGDVTLYNRETIESHAGKEAGGSQEPALAPLHRYLRNHGDLARLNGDFAFGLYDENKQQLTLVRDQAGSRILYYAKRPEGLLFSTRIHAFFETGFDRSDLDPIALASYLAMRFPGAGKTYYPAISELELAHRLDVRPDLTLAKQRYWSLQPQANLKFRRADDWIEHIRETFVRAVASRIKDAERPGIRFSGGLDSSSIAGVMCAERPQQEISAFMHVPTEAYPAVPDDDALYRQTAAEGWKNLTITPVRSDRFDLLTGPEYWENAAASPCVFAFQFGEEALAEAEFGQGVDVVLTGEGGDDGLSADAPLLIEAFLDMRFGDALREFRRLRTLRDVSSTSIIRNHLVYQLVPPSMRNAIKTMLGRPWHDALALSEEYITDKHFLRHLERNGFSDFVASPRSMREQLLQSFGPIWSPFNAFGDRFTGRYGLRVRHPMQDKDLLQSIYSAPPDLMIRGHPDRGLIRQVAEPFLPDAIRTRPGKAPFALDYFIRFQKAMPALAENFAEFERSALWCSICDARKPKSYLEQFDGDTIQKAEYGTVIEHVLLPYNMGCFLTSRGL